MLTNDNAFTVQRICNHYKQRHIYYLEVRYVTLVNVRILMLMAATHAESLNDNLNTFQKQTKNPRKNRLDFLT